MHLAFFIAKRYLFSKKSHHLINWITAISWVGIAIGSFALIVILSVFNGFERLIDDMYNKLNPELIIQPAAGKTFNQESFPFDFLNNHPEVEDYCLVLEEDVILMHDEKQHIARLRGVQDNYFDLHPFQDFMKEGVAGFSSPESASLIIGGGVAWYLSINPRNPLQALQVFAPVPTQSKRPDWQESFQSESFIVQGVFNTRQKIDEKWVLAPLMKVEELLSRSGEISSIELSIRTKRLQSIQEELKNKLGDTFTIKNRFEQESLLYRVMQSEKWAIYLILAFVLFMASFTLTGTLILLIIDKSKDMASLISMGANQLLLRRIFLLEGLLITLLGGVLGVLMGMLLVGLQQYLGFVSLGDGNYIVDAYPVYLKIQDVFLVLATVVGIGLASSWLPVYHMRKKLTDIQIN